MNRRLGQQGALANNLIDLGFIALAENRRDAAATAFREGLALCRAERIADELLLAVEGLAALALDHGDAVEAVRLLAATTRPRAELGIASTSTRSARRSVSGRCRLLVSSSARRAFAAAWEEGEGLSLEEAAERGFADLGRPRSMLRNLLSFGVTVMPDPPFSRMLELMQLAERNGFEYGWTYDSHILWQESYALLPLVADKTEKIKLGHCVTNPGIRDPTITASWYATMQDLSGGRMVMGIGRGDSSRRVVGLKPVRVAEFERRLRMMKDLMNGRQVEWNEKELTLEWVRKELPEIPMHVAGYGPKALGRRGPRGRRRDHPARRPADHPVDHGNRAHGREGGGPRPRRAPVHRLRAEPHHRTTSPTRATRCAGSRRWSRTTSWTSSSATASTRTRSRRR